MNSIRTTMFVYAIIAITNLTVGSSSIFPGSPPTLEELWLDSTFVGLVEVTAVNIVSVNQRAIKKHVALSVKTAIKKDEKTLGEFNATLALGRDPNPFDLEARQRYLVFIKFNEKREKYKIVSVRKMDDDTFLHFSKRLNELPEILSILDKPKLNNQLLNWYIKCAKVPCTRHEGAWGISSLRQRKRATLDQMQSLRIAEFLTAEDPPGVNWTAPTNDTSP